MTEFIDALCDENLALIRYALIAGLLASVSCGMVGTYVVARRITYLAGAIAHCVMGGMGGAIYAKYALAGSWVDETLGLAWITPLGGAVVAAMLAAIVIAVVSLRFKQREDTIISALWAVGMAAGVLLIYKTPGYQQDLMGYLFGDIVMVSSTDLILLAILDAVVVLVCLFFGRQLLAVCFDEEFARTRGLRVDLYYILLLCLTALTVVLLVSVVGIVMVIALLTLPAATAGQLAKRLWQVMLLAVLLSMAISTAGLAISYGPSLPAGPTIIILAAGLYLAVTTGKIILGKVRRSYGNGKADRL